jgi:hypothetical protein
MKKSKIFIGLLLLFKISFSQTNFNLPKPNRTDIIQQSGVSSMISSLFKIKNIPANCIAVWKIKGGYPTEAKGDSIAPIFHTWPWAMSVYFQNKDSVNYISDTLQISIFKKNKVQQLFIEGLDTIEAGRIYTFSVQQKMDVYQWFIAPKSGVIISGQNTATVSVFFHSNLNESAILLQLTALKNGEKLIVAKHLQIEIDAALQLSKSGSVSVGEPITLNLSTTNFKNYSGKVVYHWGDGITETTDEIKKNKTHTYTTAGKKRVSVFIFNQSSTKKLLILKDSFEIFSNAAYSYKGSEADFGIDYYCIATQRLAHVLLTPHYSNIEKCKKIKWQIEPGNISIDAVLNADLNVTFGKYTATLIVEKQDGKIVTISKEFTTPLAEQVAITRLDTIKVGCELMAYQYQAITKNKNSTLGFEWSVMNSFETTSLRKTYGNSLYTTDYGSVSAQGSLVAVDVTDEYGCSTKAVTQQYFYPNELNNENIMVQLTSKPPIYFGEASTFRITTVKPLADIIYKVVGNENIKIENQNVRITKSGGFIIQASNKHQCIGFSNTFSSYFEGK